MNKRVVYLLWLMIFAESSIIVYASSEKIYTAQRPIIHCKDYSEVYDARGNIKDSLWYKNFEQDLRFHKDIFIKLAYGREQFDSALFSIQFSHQFITTRADAELIKKLQEVEKIPRENTGSIVQVCHVYYVMEQLDGPQSQLESSQKPTFTQEEIPEKDIQFFNTEDFLPQQETEND
jgi:hypothetical protein